MVTFTGTQKQLTDALIDLLKLEYDAVEAYNAATTRLENQTFKSKLETFKSDHLRHIEKLSKFLTQENVSYPTGPDAKQWLAKGKVILAGLASDKAILQAMRSNEEDTNTAYDRMINRDDLNKEIKEILNSAYKDEKKHKKWIEETLETTK